MISHLSHDIKNRYSPKTSNAQATSVLKPLRKTRWRWIALILMNLILIGDFVSIESPQPIETQIEQILGINDHEYSLLYTAFALPSAIVPCIGGYLTDKLGIRPALMAFSLITTSGQILFAFGGYAKSFGILLAGRVLYAIGSDPLNVAQVIITNKWFKGKEIGLAMSLGTMILGAGRALNSYIVPILYDWAQNLFIPMSFSALICVFSTICTVFLVILDKANDKREKIPKERLSELVEEEKISLKAIKNFKLIVWLIVINAGLANGVTFSFTAFTNDMYHTQYNFSNSTAGAIISVGFVAMSLTSVLLGKVIDSYGHRASILLYSSVIGCLSFVYFLIVPECAQCLSTILPQVLLGLYIGSNQAAAYPALPLVLEEKYLGTGYGLFFVFQNSALVVLPFLAASIKEHTDAFNGYYGMFIFFTGWGVLLLVETLILYVLDKKNGAKLEKRVMKDSLSETKSEIMRPMIADQEQIDDTT